ncbi:MAG: hypothetical protein ABI914_04480 [Acidobacteriota bacterium]
MPADESLFWYWASIGFSAAGVALFLWLLKAPKRKDEPAGSAIGGRGTPRSTGPGIDPPASNPGEPPNREIDPEA